MWTPGRIPAWTPLITGERGPFRGPGNYGKNASYNVSLYNPQVVAQSDIRYTANSNIDLKDAFGYAEQDIRKFDRNNNKKLDARELTQVFNGNQQLAQQYLRVLDRNKDGQLDAKEVAAYVLFQDHSTFLLKSTVDAFRDRGLLSPQQAANYKRVIDTFTKGQQSRADGKTTALERTVADLGITSSPFISQNIIESLHSELKLDEAFNKYQRQSQGAV